MRSSHRPVDNRMWLVLNRQTLWITIVLRSVVRTVGATRGAKVPDRWMLFSAMGESGGG